MLWRQSVFGCRSIPEIPLDSVGIQNTNICKASQEADRRTLVSLLIQTGLGYRRHVIDGHR